MSKLIGQSCSLVPRHLKNQSLGTRLAIIDTSVNEDIQSDGVDTLYREISYITSFNSLFRQLMKKVVINKLTIFILTSLGITLGIFQSSISLY